jgi:hypothetical protein
MNDLLLEFLSNVLTEKYTDEQKQKLGIPKHAISKGGRWYDGDTYVGRVVGGKFIRASQDTKSPTNKKSSKTPPSPKKPEPPPTKSILDPDTTVRDMQLMGDAPTPMANDVVDGIFAEASKISIGPDKTETAVRQIIDEKGNVIDVSTEKGREKAVEILNARIQQFTDDGTIKMVCERLGQKLESGDVTRLRKWLGNLGEICALRDMLAAGIESYLLQDSNPKNDIVSVIDCGKYGKPTGIRLVSMSTKSSKGKKIGHTASNSQVYIADTVSGKRYQLRYGEGGRGVRTFKAQNVVNALFSMQTAAYRELTRGAVSRRTRGGPKLFVEPPDFANNWDKTEFEKAQKAGTKRGQRLVRGSRKVTRKTITDLFDNPDSPVYKILLSNMTKVMLADGPREGESADAAYARASEAAEVLIRTLVYRLLGRIPKNPPPNFSLNDFDKWFTDEIIQVIDAPHQDTGEPSSLAFNSDMMHCTFDAERGYVGMKIVSSEDMYSAVKGRYPEWDTMSTEEKLKLGIGWDINSRAITNAAGDDGYIGALPRATAPIKLVPSSSFMSPEKFAESKCLDAQSVG